jgi:hypothetical protein
VYAKHQWTTALHNYSHCLNFYDYVNVFIGVNDFPPFSFHGL